MTKPPAIPAKVNTYVIVVISLGLKCYVVKLFSFIVPKLSNCALMVFFVTLDNHFNVGMLPPEVAYVNPFFPQICSTWHFTVSGIFSLLLLFFIYFFFLAD